MRKCLSCDAVIDQNDIICPYCGTSASDSPATAVDGEKFNEEIIENKANGEPEAEEAVVLPQDEQFVLPQTEHNDTTNTNNGQYGQSPQIQYAPNKQNKSKFKNAVSAFFAHFASFFICLILFALIVATSIVASLRIFLNETNIKNAISDLNLVDMTVEKLAEDDNIVNIISEEIYENVDSRLLDKVNFSVENISEILTQDFVSDMLSDTVNEYLDSIINGNGSVEIKSSDIIEIIEKNEDAIYDITEYRLSDQDYSDLKKSLDQSEILESVSLKVAADKTPVLFAVVKWTFSYLTIGMLCCFIVLLGFCVVFLHKNKLVSFYYLGVSFVLSSVVLLSVSLIPSILTNMVNNSVSFDFSGIEVILKNLTNSFLIPAVVIGCIGIILFIIAIIFGAKKSPKIKNHI